MFAPRDPREGWQVLGAEPPTYSQTLHVLMDDVAAGKLSHGAAFTYAVLDRYGWSTGTCILSHAQLAKAVKTSVRQLQRYLQNLIVAGYITEQPHGRGQAKAYRLPARSKATPVSPFDRAATNGTHDTGVVLEPPPHDTGVGITPSNTTPVSHLKKKTPETGDVKPEPAASQPGTAPAKSDEKTARQKAAPKASLQAPAAAAAKPVLPVPKPDRTDQRMARIIDLIRADGLKVSPTSRDGLALKSCTAEVEEVASCYCAVARGEYGDDFNQRRLSIHSVISDVLNGWLNRDQVAAGRARGDPNIAPGWPGAPLSDAAKASAVSTVDALPSWL